MNEKTLTEISRYLRPPRRLGMWRQPVGGASYGPKHQILEAGKEKDPSADPPTEPRTQTPPHGEPLLLWGKCLRAPGAGTRNHGEASTIISSR